VRTREGRCVIFAAGYWRRSTGTAFAAVTAPTRVSAQLLLHLVAHARFSDKLMLQKCVNR
jgi:uridylate kinase